ncbi:NAD(P)-dependent alcohol dehydrogenase [Candidatus Chloroploca sp. M-50]|uniref:NAD(P)-dependent alcohol dehydrogenase n=2 Tax=Candidatus Chloroploca mongolica TaxID=2528176 RepID=A0ABS4DHC4_9CHLR|nr:NAD(P)-dependent alcohol dehydrogenase [Candidatus Chloroploca mongolica]
MQAMTYQTYGAPDVLQLTTFTRPVPKAGEVLVQIHAASLNQADLYLLRGKPWVARLSSGLRRPKRPTLGADIAGRVITVGGGVTQFQPGDAVYGDLAAYGFGGFAEYVCVRAEALAPKPASLSFAQAAAVPMAAVTALQGMRAAGPIAGGARVLIHGASGGVGTFAVQLAKTMGAHVTAVCSARHVEQARTLGAEHVIDYTQEDFTRDGRRYDLILVVNGRHPLAQYRRALSPRGRLVVVGGDVGTILRATLLGSVVSLAHSITVRSLIARPSRDDLLFVGQLLDSGVVVPVIDRCYPLGELPEAMRYLATGHARGKIVITMEQADQ